MDATVFTTAAFNILIAFVFALILIISVLKLSKTARQISSVWVVEVAMKKISEEFFDQPKFQLLSPVKSARSVDAEREKRGELVVLEMGVGGGGNFKFYPPGTKLICVDPNRHFKKYFKENKEKFPTVEVERFLFCGGEDIDEVEDESVDIVVATHVLCSVDDVDKVVSQVKRVLAKGGKFYYADHVRAPGRFPLWIQILLEPLIKLVACNCHLTRDTASAISKAGFSEVLQETKPLPKVPTIFKHHTIGVATK